MSMQAITSWEWGKSRITSYNNTKKATGYPVAFFCGCSAYLEMTIF